MNTVDVRSLIVANLTKSQVAKRLGISSSQISRLLNSKTRQYFPNAFRKNPLNERSHWLIPEKDVERIEEKRRKS